MAKGKGKENTKKDKKSKTTNAIPDNSDVPSIQEIGNPNFCFGSDGFIMQNGDCYIGGFCAHINGIVWREGPGIYITKDDHSYEGIWENDKLLSSEETIIKYPDGVEYRGSIQKSKYVGTGTYILPNTLPISCTFQDNKPVGEATLTDPANNLWKGTATEENILLLPENHFYINLSYEKGIGKKITPKITNEEVSVSRKLSHKSSMKSEQLKEFVFKKSTKTKNDFPGSSTDQAMCTPEEQTRPRIPVPKSSLLKAKSSNASLLKIFMSKEYQNSCTPIPVFYPSDDWN